MTSRIPHLLHPYLTLPPDSDSGGAGTLTILTSVLGASTNWLVLRHLYSLLKSTTSMMSEGKDEDGEGEGEAAVLLISFLRDLAFWKEQASRLGLDLEGAARRGRFGFVDGLGSGLFTSVPPNQQHQQERGGWKRTLGSAAPGDIERVVLEGVEGLRRGSGSSAGTGTGTGEAGGRKVVVVVDGLDFVLAAASSPGTALAMKEMLMELREKTHAAIVTLAADDPLIKEQETALEKQHAWFALSLAHEADTVFSLRLLDTGAAKDVSGVVRITHGGARTENHEYLYHVGGDGGVRVFERGQ